MRTHPKYTSMAVGCQMSEIQPVLTSNGSLRLKDHFDRMYDSALVNHPELRKLAETYDYETDGYSVLLRGPGMPERSPVADVVNGRLQEMQQGVYHIGREKIEIEPLEPDLFPYRKKWTDMFNRFARIMIPSFGENFEIRIKCLQFDEEDYHFDQDIIALLPLGEKRPGTILKFPDGHVIRPVDNELVITTPGQEHGSPACNEWRACLAATKSNLHFR